MLTEHLEPDSEWHLAIRMTQKRCKDCTGSDHQLLSTGTLPFWVAADIREKPLQMHSSA